MRQLAKIILHGPPDISTFCRDNYSVFNDNSEELGLWRLFVEEALLVAAVALGLVGVGEVVVLVVLVGVGGEEVVGVGGEEVVGEAIGVVREEEAIEVVVEEEEEGEAMLEVDEDRSAILRQEDSMSKWPIYYTSTTSNLRIGPPVTPKRTNPSLNPSTKSLISTFPRRRKRKLKSKPCVRIMPCFKLSRAPTRMISRAGRGGSWTILRTWMKSRTHCRLG